jgi:hypothetical protein
MNKFKLTTGILAAISIVALTGCNLTIGDRDINLRRLQTGPMQTEPVNVPMPSDKSQLWDVELSPGAATVTVNPGDAGLVQGTIDYNVPEYKPTVTTSGNRVRVQVEDIKGIPPNGVKNDWKLSLGRGVPINLTVNTGASKGTWELGGLSLRNLTWRQGAADAEVRFSESNPETMGNLRFELGAGSATVRGLGNANIDNGFVSVGAANLTLYFDGELSEDVYLTIEGGAATVTIYSGGNPVRVQVDNAMSSVKTDWTKSGDEYTSPDWNEGAASKINIIMRIGVGTVNLKSGE